MFSVNNTLRRIKDHFIPSKANDFQPHFLRLRFALLLLAFIFTVEGFFLAHTLFILPNSNYFAAIFATVLVDETNNTRSSEKLGQLRVSSVLEKAAQLKADDMAAKGYFAHNSPDGKTPWYWFEQVGYDYAAAGENLAVNFTDSKDVTEAWLASPTHRANIMNANYTEIGIATAKGMYKGKDAIFVVQEFGRPSLIARSTGVASTSVDALVTLISSRENDIKKATTAKPVIEVATRTTVSTTPTPPTPTLLSRNESSTTSVAGASSQKLSVADDVAPIDSPILTTVHSGFAATLLASPRQTSTMIYLILAAILTLALGLAIFIKIRVQHPHIIKNGILLIAVIIALILLNSALGITEAII
jgi:uncharacterized protein YkwD